MTLWDSHTLKSSNFMPSLFCMFSIYVDVFYVFTILLKIMVGSKIKKQNSNKILQST